ncbi:MAG: hypothetical protein M8357_03940 [Desulfobulbaceae bacterium]|nr:hypothetical protein [Desulfobulbaceae bacterium]
MDKQLIPISELFSRTWTQYKRRALPLLAVLLIGTVMFGGLSMITVLFGIFGGAILAHVIHDTTAIFIMAPLMTILLLAVIILFIWCQTALAAIVVDEELGIIEAFQRGWEYLWPMTWVVTILSGILTTGFALGVLPGFLFLVWFSFCPFILLAEDRRGLDALLVSREYVRGYGWNTFGKMAVVWLLSVMAAIVPFLGQLLSILFAPFFMLYILEMYHDLKSVKGAMEPETGGAGRIFWWAVTIIGFILPIAVLLGLLYFVLTGGQDWLSPQWQDMHRTSI